MHPWVFKDSKKETKFREYFFHSVVTRYRSLLRWNLVGIYVSNVTAALLLLIFDEGDIGQYFGLLLRWAGTITSTFMYCIDWSEGKKPIVAKGYMWLARIFFILVGAIEAGLKQPDSKLKVGLLWATYVGGVFLPTYEEYLSYSIVITYMELSRLLIFGGPCPVDSGRVCTSYELWERFAHHTLYLGIAAWIQYHANSDRRRDFAKRSRKTADDRLKGNLSEAFRDKDVGCVAGSETYGDDSEKADGGALAKDLSDGRSERGGAAKEDAVRRRSWATNAPAWDEAAALGLLCLAVRLVMIAFILVRGAFAQRDRRSPKLSAVMPCGACLDCVPHPKPRSYGILNCPRIFSLRVL